LQPEGLQYIKEERGKKGEKERRRKEKKGGKEKREDASTFPLLGCFYTCRKNVICTKNYLD
jgi:hypothetical protein